MKDKIVQIIRINNSLYAISKNGNLYLFDIPMRIWSFIKESPELKGGE